MLQTSQCRIFFSIPIAHDNLAAKAYLLETASLDDNQLRFLSILRNRMVLSFYHQSLILSSN